MKKKLALALAASMMLTMSLASCGSNVSPPAEAPAAAASSSGGDTNVGIVTGGPQGRRHQPDLHHRRRPGYLLWLWRRSGR